MAFVRLKDLLDLQLAPLKCVRAAGCTQKLRQPHQGRGPQPHGGGGAAPNPTKAAVVAAVPNHPTTRATARRRSQGRPRHPPEARADPAEARPKEDAATWPDKASIEARPSEGDAATRPDEYATTRPNEATPEATPDEASPAAALGRGGLRSQGR